MSKNVMIGIYKIPPKWNDIIDPKYYSKNIKNVNYIDTGSKSIFKESTFDNTFRITSIKDNIYLKIFIRLVIYYKPTIAHYIFIDTTIKNNIRFKFNNIFIWILNNKDDILYFRIGDFFFLRGNYINFYNNFVPDDSKIIFYPATSITYKYINNNSNKVIKINNIFKINEITKKYTNKYLNNTFYKKINVALIHEDEIYKNIYKYSKLINFYKFPSTKFNYLNLKRTYDFIFVADIQQNTKNHQLIIDFILYCEYNKYKFNILYITNRNIIKKKFHFPPILKYIKLEFKNNLSPEKLNILYNKTKINVLFSGRDACPRVISESLACGCYNIALNTLSDGKLYYDNLFGELIRNTNIELIYKTNKSISYSNNPILWKHIINISKKIFNHEDISKKSIKKFNINNISQKIIDALDSENISLSIKS